MKFTRYVSSRFIGCMSAALLTLSTITTQAQQSGQGEKPTIIEFSAAQRLRADDAAKILTERLGLNPTTDELRSVYIEQPGDGLQVQRFNQYYKGIPVTHGTYTLSSRNGIAAYAFGKILPTGSIANTNPQLTEAAALAKALEFTGAERYAWQDGAEAYPTGILSLMEDFSSGEGDGVLRLAYGFDIYATAPLSRKWVYVDALTGQILFTDAIMKHVAASGATLYSDTVTFNAALSGGTYYLHDSTRGNGIYTYDLKNGTSVPSTNPAIALSSAQQVTSTTGFFDQHPAVDAHWGATVVYDYWKGTHNRNSWNGNGGILRSFVNYRTGHNNASWSGSTMLYGSGTGVAGGGFPHLTALDICSHEIGHGICQSTAGLIYSRESGALNEGFSDIWAAVVEDHGNPHETDAIAKNPWLIGEELTNTLRSMSNPKQFSQPNTYLGQHWVYAAPNCVPSSTTNDQCGVHTNSGVLNYWFYLLVTGGTGTNDIGNEYHVTGIGMAKAAKIAYATELALFSTATYNNTRTASIAAATTLYGACSPEVEAVVRAWYAVGLGANYVPCAPRVTFGTEQIGITEYSASNDCRPTHIVNVPVQLNGNAISGDSAVVTPVVLGGTAIAGVDYDLLTTSLTFKVGGPATQSVAIRVYDNGAINVSKYIDLTYTLNAGGSNVSKSVYEDTTRITISNDDHAPYAGADEMRTVLNYNTISNNSSPFVSNAIGSHNQYLYRAEELAAAGVRPGVPLTAASFFVMAKRSTMPFMDYNVRLAHTAKDELGSGFVNSGFTTVFADSFSTVEGMNTLSFSTPFVWNGTDNIAVDICYTNDARGLSNDQVQGNLGTWLFSAVTSTNVSTGTSSCSLPLSINSLVQSRPVIRFTQQTPVETVLNSTRTWEVKSGAEVYFYSHNAQKLIAGVLNPADSLGCVTATVTAAGNGFTTTAAGMHRSRKEFSLVPGNTTASGSYEAIFYFRNDELNGANTSKIRIVQTTSAADNGMNASNTNYVTPAEVITGESYTGFRGTFTGFGRFFLDGSHALSVSAPVAKAAELWTGVNPFRTAPVLHWNLPVAERVMIRLYDITGKLVYGSEQTLSAGTHQLQLTGNSDFAPGTYILQVVRPKGVFTSQLVKQ